MALITVTYGNENFQRSSAKYQVFACRSRHTPNITPLEKHMWMAGGRDKDEGMEQHGRNSRVDAAPGYRAECGKWTTARFQVPNGLLLKLYGSRKLAEMVQGRETAASMLLQTREEGPLIKVTARLTGDHRAHSATIEAFQGRADVLDLAQAQDIGYMVRAHNRPQFQEYNQRALFEVEVLAPAISQRVEPVTRTIQNTQGEEVRVTSPRRKRALQV